MFNRGFDSVQSSPARLMTRWAEVGRLSRCAAAQAQRKRRMAAVSDKNDQDSQALAISGGNISTIQKASAYSSAVMGECSKQCDVAPESNGSAGRVGRRRSLITNRARRGVVRVVSRMDRRAVHGMMSCQHVSPLRFAAVLCSDAGKACPRSAPLRSAAVTLAKRCRRPGGRATAESRHEAAHRRRGRQSCSRKAEAGE